ncbi:MAG: hypothetical protein M3Y89_17115 [Actinomycetota bacterium]|nr:hypothetical protein [Actinomycetota bacterium]
MAGTPVLLASGYPHADGELMQLWVLEPAVPPDGGGGVTGLELADELVEEAVLDGAVLVADEDVLVGFVLGVVVEALGAGVWDVVGRIGGRWWPPLRQPLELLLPPVLWEWPRVLADTAWLPSSSSASTAPIRSIARADKTPSRTRLPCGAVRVARCFTEDIDSPHYI